MTQDQIEKLAQIGADVACFRDFVPEMTRRIKALEQEFKELRQKGEDSGRANRGSSEAEVVSRLSR
jgi:hypothetical protein